MAGKLENPADWRLVTTGGIPYKQLEMSGDFTDEGGSVLRSVLIPSTSLYNFLVELFPPPIVIGNVVVRQVKTLEGFPSIGVQRVAFKQFDDAVPIDPFGFDPNAPSGTYYPVVQCDIQYGPLKLEEADENDPQTFLDISANATGEYLHTNIPKAKWQPETNPDGGDGVENPDTDEVGNGATNPTQESPEENRDPNVPVTIRVPKTEWTIQWSQVPFDFFQNVLIHRMRYLMGLVNSNTVPYLFNAPPETLLFTGYSYNQQVTWRQGNITTPPAKVTMKFVEKRIIWNGVVIGHNHVWRPGYGWQRLLLDGTNPLHQTHSFTKLFRV